MGLLEEIQIRKGAKRRVIRQTEMRYKESASTNALLEIGSGMPPSASRTTWSIIPVRLRSQARRSGPHEIDEITPVTNPDNTLYLDPGLRCQFEPEKGVLLRTLERVQ